MDGVQARNFRTTRTSLLPSVPLLVLFLFSLRVSGRCRPIRAKCFSRLRSRHPLLRECRHGPPIGWESFSLSSSPLRSWGFLITEDTVLERRLSLVLLYIRRKADGGQTASRRNPQRSSPFSRTFSLGSEGRKGPCRFGLYQPFCLL
jgi:hypothetical protein